MASSFVAELKQQGAQIGQTLICHHSGNGVSPGSAHKRVSFATTENPRKIGKICMESESNHPESISVKEELVNDIVMGNVSHIPTRYSSDDDENANEEDGDECNAMNGMLSIIHVTYSRWCQLQYGYNLARLQVHRYRIFLLNGVLRHSGMKDVQNCPVVLKYLCFIKRQH